MKKNPQYTLPINVFGFIFNESRSHCVVRAFSIQIQASIQCIRDSIPCTSLWERLRKVVKKAILPQIRPNTKYRVSDMISMSCAIQIPNTAKTPYRESTLRVSGYFPLGKLSRVAKARPPALTFHQN